MKQEKVKRISKITFYVVLFLCITALGVSGYLMRSAVNTVEDAAVLGDWGDETPPVVTPEEPVSAPAPVEVTDEGGATAENELPAEIVSGEPEDVPAMKPAPTVFGAAVPGDILTAFSEEDLVQSKTFGDWRTHTGVDFLANVGDTVSAIAAGKVTDVRLDEMMGQTVVIEHANGYTSTYCNLAAEGLCKKGATVTLGEKIGVIGQTAVAECLDPPHLHLELRCDDKLLDPMSVLKIPE